VVVDEFGADSLRLYEMFMGPLEATKPWNMTGVEGVSRFLNRVWRMIVDDEAEQFALNPKVTDDPLDQATQKLLAKTISGVTDDLEALRFNTAISKLMEFTNDFTGRDSRPRAALEPFVLLLAPLAPHIAEELWALLGHAETLAYEPWPTFDPALLVESQVEIPVQVNSKIRARLLVPIDADASALESLAREDATIAPLLEGKTIKKVVAVPGKLVNFIVG
jgi:leucyl-tRNA synthetase